MKQLPISLLFYASLLSLLPAKADPPRLIADYPHEAPRSSWDDLLDASPNFAFFVHAVGIRSLMKRVN